MVSTFTNNKHIEKPAHNDFVNTWDVPVNGDWDQIDKAFGNSATKNATGLSGNQTLAVADYVPLTLIISGLPAAAVTYVVPSGVGGQWVFANATTGGFNIGISSAAGGTTILCPAGANTLVSCDGTATGMRLSITTTPVAAGSNTQVQFNNGGLLGASSGLTWNGTTLTTTGINNTGSTVLGDAAGDTMTINGTAISTPNNLNFDTNTLFIDATNNRIGIGTATPSSPLTVAGTIEMTSGGVKFSDGSVQTTAGAVVLGAVIDYIGTTAPAGWVFANGQTIGDASSGATGRANADTSGLFTLLWNSWANAQAAVSGGRGGSAAADFAAHKTIALPDLRGTVVAALDNLGGLASAGRLSGSMASTTPGAALSVTSLNSSGVSGTAFTNGLGGTAFTNGLGGTAFTAGVGGHISGVSANINGTSTGVIVAEVGDPIVVDGNASIQVAGNTSIQVSGNTSFSGSTNSFNIAQSTMVMSKIIKL